MPRVKRGTHRVKRRKNILARTKGFRWGRKSRITLAKVAGIKADAYRYRDRRTKKRTMRSLWLVKINAAVRENGMSYSKFIGALKTKGVVIDRKILANLAEHEPKAFAKVVSMVK